MEFCIDLCSGLKGLSRAFQGKYEVVTVDIERKFRPTIIADVCSLPLKTNLKPEVLLMSPPCERFSLMAHKWPKIGIRKSLNIVGACLEAVSTLNPKYWLLENPKGRLRWFIGKPMTCIRYSDYDMNYAAQKPTDLWTNISIPMAKFQRRPRTKKNGKHTSNFYKAYGSNRAKNAEVPIGVSRTILEGIEKWVK